MWYKMELKWIENPEVFEANTVESYYDHEFFWMKTKLKERYH